MTEPTETDLLWIAIMSEVCHLQWHEETIHVIQVAHHLAPPPLLILVLPVLPGTFQGRYPGLDNYRTDIDMVYIHLGATEPSAIAALP